MDFSRLARYSVQAGDRRKHNGRLLLLNKLARAADGFGVEGAKLGSEQLPLLIRDP